MAASHCDGKTGLAYPDIIFRVKERFGMPTFADQVSREYAMLRAAADKGFIDGDKAMLEASSPLSARAQTRSSPILRPAWRRK